MFFFSLFFFKTPFLFPFKLLITVYHEIFHGLFSLFTGGSISHINLHINSGSIVTINGYFPIVIISGYICTTFLGIYLFFSAFFNIYNYFFVMFSILSGYFLFFLDDEFNYYFFVVIFLIYLITLISEFTIYIKFYMYLFVSSIILSVFLYYFYAVYFDGFLIKDAVYLANFLNNQNLSFIISILFCIFPIVLYAISFFIIFKKKRKN